jgi:hypothetical protein
MAYQRRKYHDARLEFHFYPEISIQQKTGCWSLFSTRFSVSNRLLMFARWCTDLVTLDGSVQTGRVNPLSALYLHRFGRRLNRVGAFFYGRNGFRGS